MDRGAWRAAVSGIARVGHDSDQTTTATTSQVMVMQLEHGPHFEKTCCNPLPFKQG